MYYRRHNILSGKYLFNRMYLCALTLVNCKVSIRYVCGVSVKMTDDAVLSDKLKLMSWLDI